MEKGSDCGINGFWYVEKLSDNLSFTIGFLIFDFFFLPPIWCEFGLDLILGIWFVSWFEIGLDSEDLMRRLNVGFQKLTVCEFNSWICLLVHCDFNWVLAGFWVWGIFKFFKVVYCEFLLLGWDLLILFYFFFCDFPPLFREVRRGSNYGLSADLSCLQWVSEFGSWHMRED